MPAGVPPTVVESFSALIPATFVMTFFFLVNLMFGFLGTNVFQIIFEFLQTPLLNLGDTLGAMVVAYIFLHLFWFFGINGGSVVGAVFNPILHHLSAVPGFIRYIWWMWFYIIIINRNVIIL